MAQLTLTELIEAVTADPRYATEWHMDVPARQALYIKLSVDRTVKVESDVFTGADGSVIVLDRDEDGIVHGIEIV